MNKPFRILLPIWMLAVAPALAQTHVQGLEANPAYAALLHRLDSLDNLQQNIQERIEEQKRLAESNPAKQGEYVNAVMALESDKFDIRNKIGIVTSQMNVMEQEYIMKNISGSEPEKPAQVLPGISLMQHRFILANLSQQELKQLQEVRKIDAQAREACRSLQNISETLRRAADRLATVQDRHTADSLLAVIRDTQGEIDAVNEKAEAWDQQFETRIYTYSRLLDKLGLPLSQLSALNDEGRNIRAQESDAEGSMLSPSLSVYAQKRMLELKYERILADKLGYISAQDSIGNVAKQVAAIAFREPAVRIPAMQFVDFQPLQIGGEGVHNASNPVKETEIPTYGSVYKVRLFTLSKKISSFSQLRNIHPVSLFVNEEGKYEYSAGTYATKEEAEAGYKRLYKLGMRPAIDEWRDGGKVKADGTIVPLIVGHKLFKIEIGSLTPDLAERIRELAPEKELTKVGSVFSLGVFDTYQEAANLAAMLGKECRVIAIDTESE